MRIEIKKFVARIERFNAEIVLSIFLLLSVLTGLKLGKLTAALIFKPSALTIDVLKNKQQAKEESKKKEEIKDYSILFSFNPFNPNPPPSQEQLSEGMLEETSLNLELVGTLVGKKSVAIIRNKKNDSTDLYYEGDTIIGENATIYRIEPMRVIIRRDGKFESLELFERMEISLQPFESPPPPPDIIGGRRGRQGGEEQDIQVKKISENYFEIDRNEIENATSNLGMMMTQARIVPNIVMGEIKGYKIFAIKPGSIYDKIGLRNGDVIERINGIELKTPEDALQFFKELRNENRFVIDIDRDGEKLTFTYSIK